jgi:hypothetical protein
VDAQARSLKLGSPRVVEIELRLDDNDSLNREDGSIVWRVEPGTVEDLVERFQDALTKGSFNPSELMMVRGPHGEWLRLYAELTA